MSTPDGPNQPGYPPPNQPGYPPPGPPPMSPPPPGPTSPEPFPPPGPSAYYPPPGQPGAPPPAKGSGRGRLIAIGVLVLIVVGIVAGLAFFRDRLGGEASSLQVGDCFDLPATEGDFTDVQHQPCNEPHDAEVILVMTHPAPPGESYPIISGFDDYVSPLCVPAFDQYTGRAFATETEYDLGYFHPTLSGWAEGDRGFTCHVSRDDDAKMTASVRVGAPASP